jgi:DNA polymerase III delta prime subunit
MFQSLQKDNLYHAYLLIGERETVLAELREMLEEMDIETEGNPDVTFEEIDVFLLEHAHRLRSSARYRSAEGGKKIFVFAFNTMLSEAQNALLKTLEEPTEGTHIFFVTRAEESLLSTVRSRMQVITSQKSKVKSQKFGEEFIAAGIPERLKIITPMTKADTDEKPQAKEDARKLLDELERALVAKEREFAEGDAVPKTSYANALNNVILAKKYLNDRSPSLKILLEHLALTTPRMEEKSASE